MANLNLRIPDCQDRQQLSMCAPLRRVVNLADVPIRIEAWFAGPNMWAPVVPLVPPASVHEPFAGALWLPRGVILRSVNNDTNLPLQVFGAVGEGITAVQQASALAVPNVG